jgi:DNA-binding transcriptional regulator GbsR (MarR family)
MTTSSIPAVENELIAFAGELAESFSFNRSIGQIYGFLYISGEPRSLEEAAKACHMSKGNASLHLRTLDAWGAVKRIWKPGTRKDYYTANTDLSALALRRAQEGLHKRLQFAQSRINEMLETNGSSKPLNVPPEIAERLRNVQNLAKRAEKALSLLPKLLSMRSLF